MPDVKVPKGEQVWVSYYDINKVLRFLITSKSQRDAYFLYEVTDGKLVKLGKSKSPAELAKKYRIDNIINNG